MLGKLMKYEVKATARTFLPLYGALLIFSILNRILFSSTINSYAQFQESWLLSLMSGASATIYGLLIFAAFIMTFVVAIQRFYKNLMGDEGYLMFTLPVPSWMHILSKMLVAGMWLLGSVLITVVSVCIVAMTREIWSNFWTYLPEFWTEVSTLLGVSSTTFTIEVIVFTLLGMVGFTLPLYCAITVGQLWQKHRVLGAFGAYIGLNTVMEILTGIFFRIYLDNISIDVTMMNQIFHKILVSSGILSVIFLAGCFILTDQLLKKKLNLE